MHDAGQHAAGVLLAYELDGDHPIDHDLAALHVGDDRVSIQEATPEARQGDRHARGVRSMARS